MEAYSSDSNKHYPSWEALVEAEANGWVAVAMIRDDTKAWPWVQGPYPTQKEAQKARNRMRYRLKKDDWKYPALRYSLFVRPAWKDPKERVG